MLGNDEKFVKVKGHRQMLISWVLVVFLTF